MSKIICVGCELKCEIICPKCHQNDWEGDAVIQNNFGKKFILDRLFCKRCTNPKPIGNSLDICLGKKNIDMYRVSFSITGSGVNISTW